LSSTTFASKIPGDRHKKARHGIGLAGEQVNGRAMARLTETNHRLDDWNPMPADHDRHGFRDGQEVASLPDRRRNGRRVL